MDIKDTTQLERILQRLELVAKRAFKEGFIRAGGTKPEDIDKRAKEEWDRSLIKKDIADANPLKK